MPCKAMALKLSELVQYVAQAKLSKLWFHISISFQILDINNNFYFLSSSPPLFLCSTSIHKSYYFTLHSITKLHDDIIIVKGIRDFHFKCINNTDYALTISGSQNPAIAHVGQIAKYLAFDKALRDPAKHLPASPFHSAIKTSQLLLTPEPLTTIVPEGSHQWWQCLQAPCKLLSFSGKLATWPFLVTKKTVTTVRQP